MPTAASSKKDLYLISRRARAGIITVADAADSLQVSRHAASTRLARLENAGWLLRVKRGVYFIRPIEAGPQDRGSAPDPWPIASVLFEPCYIGGWTAAHHWGLTDQLFRSTFVVTSAHIRDRTQRFLQLEFHLVRLRDRRRIEANASVWRGQERVRLSSVERTLADGLANPSWLGGFRHLVEVLNSAISDSALAPERLTEEMIAGHSGAAFKRLGYLVETLWPERADLFEAARTHITSGVVRLDPGLPKRGKLNKRWLLWLNTRVDQQDFST
jgi:predicted transcriptional regulator of viral defense system